MKKICAAILAIMMMLGCCAALAEEDPIVPMPKEAAGFEGNWACGRATIEMIWEEEGFRVAVAWGSSAAERTEWEYNCTYDADSHSVKSVLNNGTKTECVYDETGTMTSFKTVYEDGEAVFTLDGENHLIWKDLKEDAGKDMAFEYAGPIADVM